jgi:hypothetical protein
MKATKEQIAEWKAKHGDVFCVKVDDKACYLKKPSRKSLSYAMSIKDNPLKSNEILLNECWLDGDQEIKTNDDLFLAVSPKLVELLTVKEAELVKL